MASAGNMKNGNNNRAHVPNEHMRLDDFLKAAHHIALIIEGFAEL